MIYNWLNLSYINLLIGTIRLGFLYGEHLQNTNAEYVNCDPSIARPEL